MTNSDTPAAEGPYRDRPLSSLPNTLTLRYSTGGEEKARRAMDEWVKALVEEAGGRLICEERNADDEPFLPRLSVSTKAASSVHYHFVPEGPEVAVFREFLWEAALQGDAESTDSPEPTQPGPDREMLLFVSTHCPNCPHARPASMNLPSDPYPRISTSSR